MTQAVSIDSILSRLHRVRRSGAGWVALCPSHEDTSPSLSIREGDGGKILLNCFSGCGFDSILASLNLDGRDLKGAAAYRAPSRSLESQARIEPAIEGLESYVHTFHAALQSPNGAIARLYLASRKIPLELALEYGVGYAANGDWPHIAPGGRRLRQAPHGRLVFPHTDLTGRIVNLYGRAIDLAGNVPKQNRHDHLHGRKGAFNARAFQQAASSGVPLYVCEGPMDALSLIVVGASPATAIFGAAGWIPAWSYGVEKLVLALDNDDAGKQGSAKIAASSKESVGVIQRLSERSYGGFKDVNEALCNGVLVI